MNKNLKKSNINYWLLISKPIYEIFLTRYIISHISINCSLHYIYTILICNIQINIFCI